MACIQVIHAAIYEARPDVRAIVHHHTPSVVAVACSKEGLQILTQDAAAFYQRVAYHEWEGLSDDYDEKKRIALGMKQLTPHPWDALSEDLVEGTKIKGRVVVMA